MVGSWSQERRKSMVGMHVPFSFFLTINMSFQLTPCTMQPHGSPRVAADAQKGKHGGVQNGNELPQS